MSIVSLVASAVLIVRRITSIPTISSNSKSITLPSRRLIIRTAPQRLVQLTRKGLLLIQRKISHALEFSGIDLVVRIEVGCSSEGLIVLHFSPPQIVPFILIIERTCCRGTVLELPQRRPSSLIGHFCCPLLMVLFLRGLILTEKLLSLCRVFPPNHLYLFVKLVVPRRKILASIRGEQIHIFNPGFNLGIRPAVFLKLHLELQMRVRSCSSSGSPFQSATTVIFVSSHTLVGPLIDKGRLRWREVISGSSNQIVSVHS